MSINIANPNAEERLLADEAQDFLIGGNGSLRQTLQGIKDHIAVLQTVDSTGRCNTLETAQAGGVLQMKQRQRLYYTASQKALMWERWQKGESLQQIAQLFDRNHSSIEGILAETGGIRPAPRCRSPLALTLAEREEISRAVVAGTRSGQWQRRSGGRHRPSTAKLSATVAMNAIGSTSRAGCLGAGTAPQDL